MSVTFRSFALAASVAAVSVVGGSVAAPALAQETHTTGAVRLGVFDNGAVGAQAGVGPSFGFTGFDSFYGLFDGQLFVGTSASQLSGEAYAAETDWALESELVGVAAPAPFTQAYRASFSDSAAPSPLGIRVTQNSRSSSDTQLNQFVVVEYTIRNTGAAALSGVYAGMFADFDVDGINDVGAFDAARGLVYTFTPPSMGLTFPYFGVVLLGTGPVSGWSVGLADGNLVTDARVFEGMTTMGTEIGGGDRVSVLGTGPYTIPANGTVTVRYAFVAGRTLNELRTATSAARSLYPVAAAEGPEAAGVRLLPTVPNPAVGGTDLAFRLDAAADVRLAVYDVLGREVAVPAEGPYGAGTHTAALDVSALASGVYVARLTVGETVVARRFTVAR